MTKGIIISVILGIASGYLWVPQAFIDMTGDLLVAGLCLLLFFVGIDLGIEGTVVTNIKKVGVRVLVFPFATVIGTLAGVSVASLLLKVNLIDSLMVGAGLSWYTLAPVIISSYSTEIAAISFIHNVMRELLGIIFIPIVAKYVGYVECTSLAGAAAMDVCLPIVERATKADIVVYSFVSGVVLSILVPVLVPLFMGFA